MASFKALCLAGVASLAVTASAYAADLLPPPPPVAVPAPIVVGGGWYLRGDVGVGITDLRQKGSTFNPDFPKIPGLRYDASELNDAGFIDGGVGYRFNRWFRADVTGEYRMSASYGAVESYTCQGNPTCQYNPRGVDVYHGSVKSYTGLVNGYVDLGTWWAVTPYIGGGVGVTRVGFGAVTDQGALASAGGFGLAQGHYQTNFAWAGMAGLSFAVTQNLAIDFGYRYLDLGKIQTGPIKCSQPGICPNERQNYRLAYNDIRLGFRYLFADVVAPPVIAKY